MHGVPGLPRHVHAPDPRRKSTEFVPHPAVTAQGGGALLRFDHVEPSDEFIVKVKTFGVALRLVDATSGLPLDGVVTINREDGVPATGRFAVRDHGTGASSSPAAVDISGTIQLYEWSGEDLTVAHVLGKSGNRQRRDAGTILASSVQANRAWLILPSPDGRGTIVVEGAPEGEPVPERLLVCPASDLYWIEVLQSFLPGESLELPSGRLTIQWEGALPEGENLTVFVKATEPKFDAPFELLSSYGYYRDWTGAAPVIFDAVSTFVDHVKVDAKGYERASFPLEINPQIDARLKISLEDFTAKDD
jgi:hypothetical protein